MHWRSAPLLMENPERIPQNDQHFSTVVLPPPAPGQDCRPGLQMFNSKGWDEIPSRSEWDSSQGHDLCQEGLAALAPSSDGFVTSTLVQGPSCSSPAGQEHPGVQRLLHVLNSLNLILSSQQ